MDTRLPTGVHMGEITDVRLASYGKDVDCTLRLLDLKRNYTHRVTYEEYVNLLRTHGGSGLKNRLGYIHVLTTTDFPEASTRVLRFWLHPAGRC